MKKTMMCVATLLLIGCTGANRGGNEGEGGGADSLSAVQDSLQEDSAGQSLNDIRFGNFTAEDWQDNEYYREVRRYVDAYLRGEKENEELDPYRDLMTGPILLGNSQPAMFGGLYIQFCFKDNPEKVFEAWVYSFVDEARKKVTGYELRSMHVSEEGSGLTKEKVLEIQAEHPELKEF